MGYTCKVLSLNLKSRHFIHLLDKVYIPLDKILLSGAVLYPAVHSICMFPPHGSVIHIQNHPMQSDPDLEVGRGNDRDRLTKIKRQMASTLTYFTSQYALLLESATDVS